MSSGESFEALHDVVENKEGTVAELEQLCELSKLICAREPCAEYSPCQVKDWLVGKIEEDKKRQN